MAFLPSLPFESAYLTAVTQDSMGISNTSELSSGKFAPGNDAVFVDGFDCR